MMRQSIRYIPGSNWVLCDVCGFKRRAEDVLIRWDNLTVCKERSRCYEEQHPQEFVRGVEDNSLPTIITGEPDDTFIDPTDITADDL